jgi:hypothetical protein
MERDDGIRKETERIELGNLVLIDQGGVGS